MRMGKSIRKVAIFEKDSSGSANSVVVYEKEKKKSSWHLRSWERIVEHVAKAEQTFATEYLKRHSDSNEDEKNGWAKELNENLYKASRKAWKKLDPSNWFEDDDDDEDDDEDDDDDD